jgi:hypothetical protein
LCVCSSKILFVIVLVTYFVCSSDVLCASVLVKFFVQVF